MEQDGSWPIVWERANGVHVWDVEGKKYLDLTAAFGVAAAGHTNPKVVKAGQQQMAKLMHAMGDVHPHALKAQLARELSGISFERWKKGTRGKTIFCNSGFESVEAALKTAMLATGKNGVIGFEGAYHGLGYGALNATHREHFRSPFRTQLREFTQFVPFPSKRADLAELEKRIRSLFKKQKVGAILVEPIQARGGINLPPLEFLPLLRKLCDQNGALLIVDEIYTGFGRTGKWFACEHSHTIPDLICLGKALTGGFPLSACVGRADLMDAAWPVSNGEAIHTSTFLGNPVGCAMALAQIEEIKKRDLPKQSAALGKFLLAELRSKFSSGIPNVTVAIRGLGLMAGIELQTHDGKPATEMSLRAIKQMLHEGFIVLPEGEHANIIGFTPPLIISERELTKTVAALHRILSPAK
ncbi:MAG: Aminotransferase class-III [Verrucomicrobiales bacterium]|nr:Aminotransferase class-III [Verrucomicrobiales bacterium]